LHSEFGDVAQAMEYDQESAELGRAYGISNVEISALINLGLDHFLPTSISTRRKTAPKKRCLPNCGRP